MKIPLTILMTIATLSGCGSDVDLTGVYQVTRHTQNDSDCAVEGAAVDEPLYFSLAEEDLFGQEYFAYSECTSAEPSSCSGGGLFGLIFSIAVDDGWRGEVSMSSGTGDPCMLSYGEHSAVFQDDDSMRIEMRMWGEEVTVSEADCDTDEAQDRGKDMACENYEVIVGTLVE
jgi:hypothetical protein